jgi:hypothetical protein
MKGLDDLSSIVAKESYAPSDAEVLQYLFWERGISLEEFNRLPIPYIISMFRTWNWASKKK